MIDDHTLIHKAKIFGMIYLILSVLLATFLGVMIFLINGYAIDLQQSYAEHASSFESSSVILTDDVSCKTIVYYASQLSSLLHTTAVALIWFSVSITCMLIAFGVIHIRYHQIINTINPNQRLEPTVKTPVD